MTFRMDDSIAPQWENAVKSTGVSDSELIRECIMSGFRAAVSRIARKRRRVSHLFRPSDTA